MYEMLLLSNDKSISDIHSCYGLLLYDMKMFNIFILLVRNHVQYLMMKMMTL